jgi:hypothetical protein
MCRQRDLLQYSIMMDRALLKTKISLLVLPPQTGKWVLHGWYSDYRQDNCTTDRKKISCVVAQCLTIPALQNTISQPGRSGYPKSSGRVIRVLKNSGIENCYPIRDKKNTTRNFGFGFGYYPIYPKYIKWQWTLKEHIFLRRTRTGQIFIKLFNHRCQNATQ